MTLLLVCYSSTILFFSKFKLNFLPPVSHIFKWKIILKSNIESEWMKKTFYFILLSLSIDHGISEILACTHHTLGCITHIDYLLALFSCSIFLPLETPVLKNSFLSTIVKWYIFGKVVTQSVYPIYSDLWFMKHCELKKSVF